jgi:hypothetical protein
MVTLLKPRLFTTQTSFETAETGFSRRDRLTVITLIPWLIEFLRTAGHRSATPREAHFIPHFQALCRADERLHRFNGVRVFRPLIRTPASHAGKADGDARLMPPRSLDPFEGDLEDQFGTHG